VIVGTVPTRHYRPGLVAQVIFWDLRTELLENLYKHSVEACRLEPILESIDNDHLGVLVEMAAPVRLPPPRLSPKPLVVSPHGARHSAHIRTLLIVRQRSSGRFRPQTVITEMLLLVACPPGPAASAGKGSADGAGASTAPCLFRWRSLQVMPSRTNLFPRPP
jgi:hypothetical protein